MRKSNLTSPRACKREKERACDFFLDKIDTDKYNRVGGGDMEQRVLAIRLDRDVVDRIDKICKKAGMKRATLIQNVIGEVTKDLENLNKFGVLHLAVILRNMREQALHGWVKKMNQEKIIP